MFDRFSDRIATAVATGLDVAVEFATLGEYRLIVAPEPREETVAPPRPERPARVFDGAAIAGARGTLPRPTTAVLREPQAQTPEVMAICATRSHSKDAQSPPRATRRRGGTISPPEQLCLWR